MQNVKEYTLTDVAGTSSSCFNLDNYKNRATFMLIHNLIITCESVIKTFIVISMSQAKFVQEQARN